MENSQLRKHLKFGLIHRYRQWLYQQRLGFLGKGVFFDRNVDVQRFPKNVSILDQAVLKEGARLCACNKTAVIKIGKNTTIGFHTFIFASSSIIIGDDCLIAPFVYIVDSDHQIDKALLINQQPNISAPIEIGKDVWIGTGAKILKGVKIGKGAVVASGAVVNSDIGEYEIFGGIPARKIGERK